MHDAPVRFRRARGMLPLPYPVEGGSLDELRPFVNVEDEDWPLFAGWLVGALRPRGPYAVLLVHGEQGSAKSTLVRVARSLLDPNEAPVRREPRNHVGCEIFHGDAGVLDCIDVIRELAGRYELREVMYDPWRFGQAAQELEQERITVSAFPQTDVRMVPASDRVYQAVTQQRLTLPDHEELRQHMANTIARHNRRGWRLDKPSLDAPNDSIIALCMALEALENQPEPVRLVGWL